MSFLHIPTSLSFSGVLSIAIYSLIIICVFWHNNVSAYDTFKKSQPVLLIMVLLHVLFPLEAGDFYSYMQYVNNFRQIPIEPVYEFIVKIVGNHYILFRFVIWGTAYFLFINTIRRLGLDKYKTIFLFYALFIGVFDYGRVSLAMSIYFWGLSFICNPIKKRKAASYILGLIIIGISPLFHTSIFLAVAMTAMIFVPINKRSFLIVLVLFAVSTPLLMNVYDVVINGAIDQESRLDEKILDYSEQITYIESFSRLEWIRRFIQYSTFLLPTILIAPKILSTRIRTDVHIAMLRLYKVSLGIQLAAISTLMVGMSSFILFYRFLFMSMIPVTILMSYCRKEKLISSNLYRMVIVLALLGVFFGYSKMLLGGNLVN